MRIEHEAVILAAGRGSRLGERTGDTPKSLLPIGPRSKSDPSETSFLRRQVELLRAEGVERIAVVVGYRKEQLIDALRSFDLRVEIVVNEWPNISESGSLHSFQYAARSGYLGGTRMTLLLDADIVYERRALTRFLDAPPLSAAMIAPRHISDDAEQVLVYGPAYAPRYLGKGLTPELVEGLPCLGEATGIVKLAPHDHALARRAMDWMLGDPDAPASSLHHRGFGPARKATEHEELTGRLMRLGVMSGVVLDREVLFMEVDNAAEYAVLRGELYPRVLEREGA